MPVRHPQEFRDRAVKLANKRDENGDRLVSFSKLSADLGISDSCLRAGFSKPRSILAAGLVGAGSPSQLTAVVQIAGRQDSGDPTITDGVDWVRPEFWLKREVLQ